MTDEKKRPRDTRKDGDLFGFFVEAMATGSNSAIESQEPTGQQDFVNSEVLPTNMGCGGKFSAVRILEASGVKFLGVVDDDPMFQYVDLPPGWKKIPTDHSMWSQLVDDKGRERAMIFYKAAFYDRSAHLRISNRFSMRYDYNREDAEGVAVACVTDGANIIHSTNPIELPSDDRMKYEVKEKAQKLAEQWLNKNYPKWKNPGAYWD